MRPAGTGGGARPGCSAGGHRTWAQDACPPSAVSQATREATYTAIVAPGCGRRQAGVCEASNFSSPINLGWGTHLSSQKQGPALTLWGLLQWLKKKSFLYPIPLPFLQSLCRTWCHLPGFQNLRSWQRLAETRSRMFPPNPGPQPGENLLFPLSISGLGVYKGLTKKLYRSTYLGSVSNALTKGLLGDLRQITYLL